MAVNASPRGGYEFPIPRWIFEVLAIVFSAGPPMAFYIAYRAEGAWFPLIATALMVPILAMLADAAQKRIVRWSLHLLQAALLLGQVLLIVILVSITSASTYGAWFFYVSRQAASSTISYYFAIKFLFFSSLTSLALRRGNITGSLSALAFVYLTVFTVMYQDWRLAAAALILLVYAGLNLDRMRRGRWSFAAIMAIAQIGVVTLGIAALAMMGPTGRPWGVGSSMLPEGIAESLFRLWHRFPLAVDIPGFGGFSTTRRIDGWPWLSAVTVFEIEGPPGTQIHIKSQVYDRYQESSWVQSQWMLYRSDSDPAVDLEIRRGLTFPRRTREGQLRISFITDFYSSLPYTLDTKRILANGELSGFAFPGIDSGYVLERPFPTGYSFMLEMEDKNARSETRSLDDPARNAYLDIPSSLRKEVYELADELDQGSPIDNIRALQQYFFDQYRYTLNYPVIPAGRDVVSHFLMEAEAGYCVQFASSMALLLRIQGIPARYVTGFYTLIDPEDGISEVTGLNAHSWVEAWVEGRGWITVEATPPMMSGASRSADFYASYNPYEDNLTGQQLLGIMGRTIDPPAPEVPPGYGESDEPGLPWSLIILSGVGGALMLVILAGLIYLLLPRKRRISANIAAISRFAVWKRLEPVEKRGWVDLLISLGSYGIRPGYEDFEDDLLRFLYASQAGWSTAELQQLERETRRLATRIGLGRLTAGYGGRFRG
jgi:transglutaminase-like putative cysteine protease